MFFIFKEPTRKPWERTNTMNGSKSPVISRYQYFFWVLQSYLKRSWHLHFYYRKTGIVDLPLCRGANKAPVTLCSWTPPSPIVCSLVIIPILPSADRCQPSCLEVQDGFYSSQFFFFLKNSKLQKSLKSSTV